MRKELEGLRMMRVEVRESSGREKMIGRDKYRVAKYERPRGQRLDEIFMYL